MRQSISSLLLAAVLTCLIAITTFAGLTGDILGTVLDPAGALVDGATVTVKNINTGAIRVVTASHGEFSVN